MAKLKISLQPNFSGNALEAGLDEVGRGCLAGPVVAAAVILPRDYFHPVLTDSKLLSRKQREKLQAEICREAIAYNIAEIEPAIIDEVNISKAAFLAMHRAVSQLTTTPEFLIVDGYQFNPYPGLEHACIVKGDQKYYSIAAASVLAKTYRDNYMIALSEEYPEYGWEQNVGYPTMRHRQAIRELGVTPHHRMSFKLLPEAVKSVKI